MVETGLDVFLESPDVYGAVGLLATVASQTHDGMTALRALREYGINVTAVFAPEHGYFGVGAAGSYIKDEMFGDLPLYSLYGESRSPSHEVLRSLNTVVIDLQDVGLRWYTFLATILNVLRACQTVGVPVLLLDRPNPLGGVVVEGMRASKDFLSFVSPAAVPVRYGLTLGEVVLMLNEEIGAQLDVIPMRGWRRQMLYSDTGLLWCSTSPSMPDPITALVYSGTCLIEGLNVSEGRGTALPFTQIGAPFVESEALAEVMNGFALPGVTFRPCWFMPSTGKYAEQRCGGVRFFVTEPSNYLGFATGLHLIAALRAMYPTEV
ncbi:MAG: DUF1343 domain-containing protein, partial [Anaerolineae bacterium]|nr:DUF1343 domain-containing protein [Anaerolineae bacterium]